MLLTDVNSISGQGGVRAHRMLSFDLPVFRPTREISREVRIAHVHADLPPDTWGGVAHQVHHLACAQSRRGHRVTVITFSERPQHATYDVRTIRLPGRLKRSRLFRLLGTGLVLAMQDYSGFDVVHFHGDNQFCRPRTPSLRTYYGAAVDEMRHATSWRFCIAQRVTAVLESLAGRAADRSVGISEATRRALPFVGGLVPCGVDTSLFRPDGPRAARPTILFVGTLGGRKRGRLLVEAFRTTVRTALPDAELLLVGDEPAGPSGPLPGAGDGVRWLGRVPLDRLVELYREAWVFCLPSSYEGFGVPYAEAMACGAAVVATPNAGALEVLDGGRCGVVVEPADLGRALVELLSDAERRDELARRGRDRALAYDWERVVAAYDEIYREITAGPPPPLSAPAARNG
jgi:glycosyltransferase involved in cell wall biosynthesis